jgi:hypothetical protein
VRAAAEPSNHLDYIVSIALEAWPRPMHGSGSDLDPARC